MTQPVDDAQVSYVSLEKTDTWLERFTIKDGESIDIGVVESVPGMTHSVIENHEHYWADKHQYISCHEGSCCTAIMNPKYKSTTEFEQSKRKKSIYLPVVRTEYIDGQVTAKVQKLQLNWYEFNKFRDQVMSVEAGTLPFFERTITISKNKNATGQFSEISFIKKETKATWLTDPTQNQQVQDQLAVYLEKLKNSLPKRYTEVEFAEELAKVLQQKQDRQKLEQMSQQNTAQQSVMPQSVMPQSLQAVPGVMPQSLQAVPGVMPQQPLQQPVQQPTVEAQPAQQPMQQPIQQPLQQPVQQPVQQPMQQPIQQPLQQPVQQPTVEAQPLQQPVQQPTVEAQPLQQPTVEAPPTSEEVINVQNQDLGFDPSTVIT